MMIETMHALFGHVAASCADSNFLGLVPWYHYLGLVPDASGVCQLPANAQILGTHSFVLLILLAVVDDFLRIIGLLTVIFVIMAGIKYTMSQGSPDEVAKAQSSIITALAGLAISLVAIQFVAFLGNQFTTGTAGGNNATGLNLGSLPNQTGIDNGKIIPTLLTVVFTIAGALALLFLVLGGFKYITSQGDPQQAGQAKKTITYALIGLVVAILAESIVSWVVSKI